ncbi:MAG: serine/threonine protein kinase [Bacteroidales bacterium]|nr:serine/threonine protein kinase [Bacteroidales bacterium]
MNNALQVDTILKGKEYEYRIEKVLGQGSFGITYLAETRVVVSGSLGKLNTFAKVKVAIKEFFLQEMNSRSEDGSLSYTDGNSLFQNYGKKFKKEALNLAKLSHPNIVNVLEYFEANNTFYYAMEFIEGSSLDDYIKRKGKLDEQEALKYLQQTASALEYMHSQKMLHLDLKPKNIMLNINNDAVLIDFGLSKQYSENGEPESSTSIGLGTPGYAPLEQNTQNEKDFSPTIDVYSLGATLYKMLSGKTPPQASLVLNDGLDLSSIRERNISEKTLSLLEKMMSPLKKNRPQNMTEVLNLLQTTSQTQNSEEDNTTINEEDTLVNKQKEETKERNTEYVHTQVKTNYTKPTQEERKTTTLLNRNPKKNMMYSLLAGIFIVSALFLREFLSTILWDFHFYDTFDIIATTLFTIGTGIIMKLLFEQKNIKQKYLIIPIALISAYLFFEWLTSFIIVGIMIFIVVKYRINERKEMR